VKGWNLPNAERLEGNTFRVYFYVMREGKPVGPRDVMKSLDLSSPSVAYRHLQKLEALGLIEKDVYGEYVIREKANVKGYLWVGRNLVPRLLFYSFFFIGVLIAEITVIMSNLLVGQTPQLDFLFLTLITTIAMVLFLIEGSKLFKRAEAD
jgi:DNA-binding transcriptional ArsR family regulator